MSSPLLALFNRSLREDANSKATYWTRAGLSGFILAVLFIIAVSSTWTGAPGRNFFISIVSLQMLAITFIGLSYFASAIAEEKEEQTLGLLRMTDLNPLSILLGKSTSRLCGALLLLAAQFPFTVFAVTLGGISLGQIIAAYCTLGAYTFLLCNVALLGSVLARRTSGAAAFCVLVLAVLVGAGPLVDLLHQLLRKFGMSPGLDGLADALWQMTPIARLREILGTGFSGAPAGWQVAGNLALGGACFLLAWIAFERFCDRAQDESGAAGAANPAPGRGLILRARRPPRPRADALTWKDFHFLCGGKQGLVIRSLVYIALPLIVTFFILPAFSVPPTFGLGFRSIVAFIFMIDSAAMAARIFRSELDDQTLSALAILPGTIRQLAYRKGRAFLLAAIPGAISTVAIGLLQLGFPTNSNPMNLGWYQLMQTVSGWLGMILLVHIVACLSLAMRRGALPIGFVVWYASNIVATMIAFAFLSLAFGMGPSFLALVPICSSALSVIVTLILHRQCLRRLEALAAEN